MHRADSAEANMAISDLPMLSMLKTKMQWHQERQRILSENVANADTPNFQPKELVEPKFDGTQLAGMQNLGMSITNVSHMQAVGGSSSFGGGRPNGYETRPAGNAVSLEDEMMKAASNQMDYAAVASLYSKSLNLLKVAIGKA
jgi:flagellar basal-body rod protein FlgB